VTSIAAARDVLTREYPRLDCVINNAGTQRTHDLSGALPLDYADAEIAANLRGLMAMCAAFVPHLRKQPAASLISISSGLAFVP
ncbi:SDR family NAD(P)-dependent oxidoreductase, partial [Enterococcus faecium]